jgi:hypothetical protein
MKRTITYWLNARDKRGLLVALMNELYGNAEIELSGKLSSFDFSNIPKANVDSFLEETEEDSIIILKLEKETIEAILNQILPKERFIKEIMFISIQKEGNVEFLAGDNFHNECISVGPAVSKTLLDRLVSQGILRKYTPHSEIVKKYPYAWKN